jgi:hypothetical protein
VRDTQAFSDHVSDENSLSDASADNSGPDHKKSLRRSWRTSGPVARLTVVFSGIAAAATVIYAIVAFGQFIVMNRQLTEIKDSAGDTHTLAVAADTQAKKMSTMSDAAEKIKEASQGMVTQEQRIADNAKDALYASNRQNKAAFDATISTSRLDQRAWVGVEQLVPAQEFSETQGIPLAVIFFNSGKTPARNVEVGVRYKLSQSPIDGPYPEDVAALVLHPERSIAPQGRYTTIIGEPSFFGNYSRNAIDGTRTVVSNFPIIRDKKIVLYYYGMLRYDDNSGQRRSTEFCVYLADFSTKTFGFCNKFNDMN